MNFSKKKVLFVLGIFVSVLHIQSHAHAQGQAIDDSQAAAVIEAEFNGLQIELPLCRLKKPEMPSLLGETASYDPEKLTINNSYVRDLKIWEKIGAVTNLEIESPFYVNYAPTQQAFEYGEVIETNSQCGFLLRIPQGTSNVDMIINKEEKICPPFRYNIIKGVSNVEVNNIYAAFLEEKDIAIEEKRKFIVLLKYDDFSDKWVVEAWDAANLDEDFSSNSVGKKLCP